MGPGMFDVSCRREADDMAYTQYEAVSMTGATDFRMHDAL